MPATVLAPGVQRNVRRGLSLVEASPPSAASGHTSVAASASTNTKGTWVELITATDGVATGILVQLRGGSTIPADHLVDIGVGGAASEVVLIPDLVVSSSTDIGVVDYFFPLLLPAGTRISARSQSTTGSQVPLVGVCVFGGNPARALTSVAAWGATAADSGGVSVDPGAVANTKGAWTELSASIEGCDYLALGFGNQLNNARAASNVIIDLGIGGAGSEVVVLPDVFLRFVTGADVPIPGSVYLPLSLPAGARLSARSSTVTTDATDRLVDVVAYGAR